jgi:para-nitrobenzyl esterase
MKIARWQIFLSIVFLVFAGLVFTSPMVKAQVSPLVSSVFTSPIDALNAASSYVQPLPPTDFVKKGSQKTILNTIKAAIKLTTKGDYYLAFLKLYNLEANIDTLMNTGSDQDTTLNYIDAASNALLDAEETITPTLYGLVSGVDTGYGSWLWAGVPYAKPPVGKLRWMAPQDPKPWKGIRLSTIGFQPAVQPNQTNAWLPQLPTPIGSEDCLYLNIFAPQWDRYFGSTLPVFVWIHGGANIFGMANVYNAAYLAANEGMIVVVIQYRLGPFGWLYFPALNPKGTLADQSGNYGTLDQIKAVQWVKNNIRFFGGNPNNITVGGQSAGGFNTLNLLTSPLTRNSNLFQKALVMSAGGGDAPASTTLALTIVDKLRGSHAGMTDAQIAAYLRKQPAYAIEQALMVNGSIALGTISPFKDGTVIDNNVDPNFDPIADNIAAGNYSKIPTILGSTEYEPKPFEPLLNLNWVFYVFGTAALGLGPSIPGFLPSPSQTTFEAIWAGGSPNTEQNYQYSGYYGGLDWKAMMVDRLAILMTGPPNNQTNVYAYRFMWGGVDDPGDGSNTDTDVAFLYGAGHASDIAFFFGWDTDVYGLDADYGLPLFNSNNEPGRSDLKYAMMNYLATFAYSGVPSAYSQPTWEPWAYVTGGTACQAGGAGTNTYITFDAPLDNSGNLSISMQDDFYTDECVQAEVTGLGLDTDSYNLVEAFMFFHQP